MVLIYKIEESPGKEDKKKRKMRERRSLKDEFIRSNMRLIGVLETEKKWREGNYQRNYKKIPNN